MYRESSEQVKNSTKRAPREYGESVKQRPGVVQGHTRWDF